jgi:para-nitrobenzyl esterase
VKIFKSLIVVILAVACVFSSIGPRHSLAAKQEGKKIDIVKVEGGLVKGIKTDVGGVQLFKGIPFTGSTASENRWKAPQPVELWDGIKISDSWGDQVMQDVTLNPIGTFWGDEFYFDDSFTPEASENGLNLNVYTPAKKTNDKLPVLVYIHGGGNNHGHASEMEFYASKLAEKGIIVVTVQYRVSMFGFLALPELSIESEKGVSGNYAVLDLVKSLNWVNDYIAGFGGNPKEVTIAGQSAGAMNVTALLRTPLADGLFNRAIIQSGFYGLLTAQGASVYKPIKATEVEVKKAVTKAFGKEMSLDELRSLPAEYFMTTKTADGTETLYDALTEASLQGGGYILDGYVFTEESVDLMREGALDGIDIMIGGTADEMTSLVPGPSSMSMEDFQHTMKATYGEEYVKGYHPTNTTEAYNLSLRARSDQLHQTYLLSAEYIQAHNKNLNVYTYYFDHAPPGRNSEFYGAFHSSDLWYFFNSIRNTTGQRSWTPADYSMADMMSSYYANFVKKGNPNGKGLTKWNETNYYTGENSSFIRWFDGKSENVTSTSYPLRDALNREVVLKTFGIMEQDLK